MCLIHQHWCNSRFNCNIFNKSEQIGLISVQGPKSLDLINEVFKNDFTSIKKFNFLSFSFKNSKVIISNTGYTGSKGYELYINNDIIIVPVMCILCVAIPFVLVTIAPRFITAAEVNLFFLLETIIGPIWVWVIINEQPSIETLQGGAIIVTTLAIHSFLKLKKN